MASSLIRQASLGIFVYRNISDLEKIMDYAEQPHITRASVIGGGVSRLEISEELYQLIQPALTHLRDAAARS